MQKLSSINQAWSVMYTKKINGVSINDAVGGGDAALVGRSWVDFLIRQDLIPPEATILDYGCGCGRIALALLEKRPDCKYIGVDIVPEFIEFCHANITSINLNFEFFLIQSDNQYYKKYINKTQTNLTTHKQLEKQKFDIAIVFSLFTHLDLDDTGKIMKFLRRSVHSSGSVIFSLFLIDQHAKKAISNKKTWPFTNSQFDPDSRGLVYDNYNGPLSAVGYTNNTIETVLREAELDGMMEFYRGFWRGSKGRFLQDVIVSKPLDELPGDFCAQSYLNLNSDVKHQGMSPAFHYLVYGKKEGRKY